MNRFLLTALFAVALCASGLALAAEPSPTAPSPVQGKTAIITDDETDTVRIQIDGKDVVVIDATGLHVVGDVAYTGLLEDNGAAPAP